MSTAQELALAVLEKFGSNVVSRSAPQTYGAYARAVGREAASNGLAVGKAMHAIGAICIFKQVPVAPLHWVRREDDQPRGIFESDPLERHYILDSGDFDTMYVVAREHTYTEEEFAGIARMLSKTLEHAQASNWSPHELWRRAFYSKPKESEVTYYQRAMALYRKQLSEMKSARQARK